MDSSNSGTIKSYRDLVVWQKSMDVVLQTYVLTEGFPRSELYGLTSQMRRAAISIPSNIAEGKMRGTRKDYRNFLINALGSGSELETQIDIAKKLHFISTPDCEKIDALLEEVLKMLNTLVKKLNTQPNT
jgi:four helix bundle protein